MPGGCPSEWTLSKADCNTWGRIRSRMGRRHITRKQGGGFKMCYYFNLFGLGCVQGSHPFLRHLFSLTEENSHLFKMEA